MNQTGRWIWGEPNGPANSWRCFRHEISLASVPQLAMGRIAADSKYWLWVNGDLAIFEGGLKRGPNPRDSYVDEVDLTGLLLAGPNAITALVWHWGQDGFSHNDSGRGGLLVDLTLTSAADQPIELGTDARWLTRLHPGYRPAGTHATERDQDMPGPNYRMPEWDIDYDARAAQELGNWRAPDYATDAQWVAVTEKGTPPTHPWGALVPRPIPLWRRSALMDYANAAVFPQVATGTPIIAQLPYNAQVTPYLEVDTTEGQRIGMRTDLHCDGQAAGAAGYLPGITNVSAGYTTTAGAQAYESLGWMSGEQVVYDVPVGVRILQLGYRESGYDADQTGEWESGDAFFDSLWQKVARTMYVCLRDSYMDCPTRERAQWIGDVVNISLAGSYVFDTRIHAMTAKAIREFVDWQRPDSSLFTPVPAGLSTFELPVQDLAAIHGIAQYAMYSGDVATATAARPALDRYLALWSMQEDGLVAHRTGSWDWGDWGDNIDAVVLDNAWYALALDAVQGLRQIAGEPPDEEWTRRRRSIHANFHAALWDPTEGAYRAPAYHGDTDDRGNALAVVAGLGTRSTRAQMRQTLRRHRNASPYMELWVLDALYALDDAAGAETRLRDRYAAQVASPRSTLWELWDNDGALDPLSTVNHGWSSGPVYALGSRVAGVRPSSPGFGSVSIRPQPGSFATFRSVVPTPHGSIVVEYERSDDQVQLQLSGPADVTGHVVLPTAAPVQVDGRQVDPGDRLALHFADGPRRLAWSEPSAGA